MADDLKVTKTEIKSLKNGFLADKLKKTGYKINNLLIIVVAFLIPLGLILYLGSTEGWGQRWQVKCPSDAFNECRNPFYSCDSFTTLWCPDEKTRAKVCAEDPGFCTIAILKPGEIYGHKRGFIETNFFSITIFFTLLAYGLNHLFYNSAEQRKKRVEVNIK